MSELKKYFRPEFLNRIDDIVMFNSLDKTRILKIVELLLEGVNELLVEKHINVSFSQSLKTYLGNVGYDSEFGARPMKRAITNTVLNSLATKMIAEEVKEGDKLILDIDENGKLKIKKD